MSATQPSLFPVNETQPRKCTCGTTRKSLCKWAADKHHYGIDTRQPKTCLLRYDQANAEIPY
jgi:hypothetical protein